VGQDCHLPPFRSCPLIFCIIYAAEARRQFLSSPFDLDYLRDQEIGRIRLWSRFRVVDKLRLRNGHRRDPTDRDSGCSLFAIELSTINTMVSLIRLAVRTTTLWKPPFHRLDIRSFATSVTMASQATVSPLPRPNGSTIDFGAVISNVDIEQLTGKIRAAMLWSNEMIVIQVWEITREIGNLLW
jgi:hypothetical protein